MGQVVSVAGQTGEFAPLHCTAHGKALLADCDLNDAQRPVRAGAAPGLHPQHHHLADQAGQSLRAGPRRGIRARRWRVHRRGEVRGGADSRPQGDIVASVGISSPVTRLHTKRMRVPPPRSARRRGRSAPRSPTERLGSDILVVAEGAAVKCWLAAVVAVLLAAPLVALDGDPAMHDPSTIVLHNGTFYAIGTGTGLPISISEDGWTWRRAGTLMQGLPGGRPGQAVLARGGNNTWAPDVIRSGDKYFVYYSAPGTQPKAAIGLLVGTTLDPHAPDFTWEDRGPVVWSDGVEDSNAIDPGVFRDPTNGSLWLTYGSYFGYIRLVELNPKTGQRLYPERKPVNVAINSEASIVIFRDGWYYLLVTHGSCCAGANSSYNIRMGRSRRITGPFVDNIGIDMLQGGGKLLVGSGGRHIGPGHFGLLDLGDGVQKFSMHFEADLDRGGISVLDIRPLLWRDGWPVPQRTSRKAPIRSNPRGPGPRSRWPCRVSPSAVFVVEAGAGAAAEEEAGANRYLRRRYHRRTPRKCRRTGRPMRLMCACRPICCRRSRNGRWRRWPMPVAIPGRAYFKITIAGTDRTLTATADRELTVLPAFTGAPEQLWRIDQLTDATYRLIPKATPGVQAPLALSAVGSSMPTLTTFDPNTDRQRWILKAP